jgi:hypothetical protein
VDIDRLYPTDSGNSALVRRIYKTLQSSLQHIDKARESLAADDFIDSDYHVTAVQGDLPELFCAASISEGLRIFVVTLHYALTNRRGAPLTIEQISAIYLCLLRLKKMIFIRLEEALDLVDKLESVGLNTDPPEAAALNKLLLDESSS